MNSQRINLGMYSKRDANLDVYIRMLEGMAKELGGMGEAKNEELKERDEFSLLKRQVAQQIQELRNKIQERENLLRASSGLGGKQCVILSCDIRCMLRKAKDYHSRMQIVLSQDEKQRPENLKGKGQCEIKDIDNRGEMVELIGKHIVECEKLEKARFVGYSSSVFSGCRLPDIERNVKISDLPNIDPEVQQGLDQLGVNDKYLDQELDHISRRMDVLLGLAHEQAKEIKLQGIVVEQINDNMGKATDHLVTRNQQLATVLQDAGGATNIVVRIFLLILILATTLSLYKLCG